MPEKTIETTLQVWNKLHTQVRAANALTASLRLAMRRAKKAQVFRDCVQSALDRYQFAIETSPERLERMRQWGVASMMRDVVPLGPMQKKCLQGACKGGLDLAAKVEPDMSKIARPTLDDLQHENAAVDPLERSEREHGMSYQQLENAAETCVGILNASLQQKSVMDSDIPTDVKHYVKAEALLLCKQGRVIDAIRYIRDSVPCTLRGAKLYVDSLRVL